MPRGDVRDVNLTVAEITVPCLNPMVRTGGDFLAFRRILRKLNERASES
jgi:hypothetical protein